LVRKKIKMIKRYIPVSSNSETILNFLQSFININKYYYSITSNWIVDGVDNAFMKAVETLNKYVYLCYLLNDECEKRIIVLYKTDSKYEYYDIIFDYCLEMLGDKVKVFIANCDILSYSSVIESILTKDNFPRVTSKTEINWSNANIFELVEK